MKSFFLQNDHMGFVHVSIIKIVLAVWFPYLDLVFFLNPNPGLSEYFLSVVVIDPGISLLIDLDYYYYYFLPRVRMHVWSLDKSRKSRGVLCWWSGPMFARIWVQCTKKKRNVHREIVVPEPVRHKSRFRVEI